MAQEAICCLCGSPLQIADAEWHRELARCPDCGLNARMRGVVLALSAEIYGDTTLPLQQRSERKDVQVLGISDSELYADTLAAKFSYLNTFLHQPPLLDVCDAAACRQFDGKQLVVCTDVIEHTLCGSVPVLRNLLSMLRPGGALILTAPSFAMDATVEWYGAISRYTVERQGDDYILCWENRRGQRFVDDAPIFHGGAGATAELRLLSHAELESTVARLGGSARTVPFQPEWGYSWPLVRQFAYLDAPVDGRVIVCRAPPDANPEPVR